VLGAIRAFFYSFGSGFEAFWALNVDAFTRHFILFFLAFFFVIITSKPFLI